MKACYGENTCIAFVHKCAIKLVWKRSGKGPPINENLDVYLA